MRTISNGLLLMVGLLGLPVATFAEEAMISNHDLLMRLQNVEAELAAVNSGAAVSYDGCGGGCNSCCDCCGGGWYVFYENVILQPHFTQNNAYYLEEPTVSPQGQHAVPFDWDFDYSPRIELGYMSDCGCLGWRARYWRLDADTTLSDYGDNGVIYAQYAEGGNISEIGFNAIDFADFTHSLEMDVLDLEVAFRECDWTYSAGFRYAHMEQLYVAQDLEVASAGITSGHDFDAYGLTAAAEVVKPWCGGLSVFAKVRGSALFGDSSWFAVNNDRDGVLTAYNDDDLLAVGEFQIGLQHQTCLGCNRVFFMRLAAEAQYWLNAGTGGPIQNAIYDIGNHQNGHPQDADMGLFGGTFGLGLLY